MTFPTDSKARKGLPIVTGVLDYFPDAIASVAEISLAGNTQHNPGMPLGWTRGISMDHADTAVRHLMERGTLDTDGKRHSAKAAWRALAELQEEIERETGAPPSRASRTLEEWRALKAEIEAAAGPAPTASLAPDRACVLVTRRHVRSPRLSSRKPNRAPAKRRSAR